MSISVAKLISGQNEIDRMSNEVQMIVGLLVFEIPHLDEGTRTHTFGNKESGPGFWKVEETRHGITVSCFTHARYSTTLKYTWSTETADRLDLERIETRARNSDADIKLVHDSLNILIEGAIGIYPGLEKKLAAIQALATI